MDNESTDVSSDDDDTTTNNNMPMCWYGTACYRQNPDHKRRFRHPGQVSQQSPEVNVSVKLELSHVAFAQPPSSPNGDTHMFTVYVRGANSSTIEHFVEKVVFNLPETFSNPIRVVEVPLFSVNGTCRREFTFPIDVYFKSDRNPKKVRFYYNVYLKPITMLSDVRSEILTFGNPTVTFKERLLKGGGEIQQRPDRSTLFMGGLDQPSCSTAGKRKRTINVSSIVDTGAFGNSCISKLRKLNDMCQVQKTIAEKLISEVLDHAELKALTNESAITLSGEGSSAVVKEEPVELEDSLFQNSTVPLDMKLIPGTAETEENLLFQIVSIQGSNSIFHDDTVPLFIKKEEE